MQTVTPRERGLLGRLLTAVLVLLIGMLVVCMATWATLFLWLSNIPSAPVRVVMAAVFATGTLASFLLLKRRWRTLLVFLIVFAGLVAWYRSIPPSNDREWAPEVAVLPVATVNGSLVEIKNIRNFDYRSETDFTPRYYDKTFDLDTIESADLICVYWGNPAIAHVMGSFGFAGDEFVSFSIEMRKEKDEPGSMLKSFFRHYELIYVVADERDVIRVRTNYREPREDVHVYRTRLPVEDQRKMFLSYVTNMNELAQTPKWYNTLEDNCTTGMLHQTEAYKRRARYTWKVLLSGLRCRVRIRTRNARCQHAVRRASRALPGESEGRAAGQSEEFSLRIREGIPMPEPYTLEEFESPQ